MSVNPLHKLLTLSLPLEIFTGQKVTNGLYHSIREREMEIGSIGRRIIGGRVVAAVTLSFVVHVLSGVITEGKRERAP
jgi:uncharacterized membrane protein YvlD (DUF360 family)